MNNTLFAMHDIKYVISVDDCYFAPRREEGEGRLYAEMQSSMERFREKLISIGKNSIVGEYDQLTEMGMDSDSFVRDLIRTLTDDEIVDLLSVVDATPYQNEKTGILAFLSELQSQGCIHKYYTLGSTMEAMSLDFEKAGMTDGNILWLLDRNFERVGESPDAGIQLAQNIVQKKTKQINYIYILSAVDQEQIDGEDDIEAEVDNLLKTKCTSEAASLIYYIHKQRILLNQEKKIEKSFAQGFKRKVCFELFQLYCECLNLSVSATSETILGIKQKTLNYLFAQKVKDKGESHIDFLTRLVQIYQLDEYNRALAEKHELIADRVEYYNRLCEAVKDGIDDATKITPVLKEVRRLELYNKHINSQHLEISTGDIFEISERFFLLVSQSCDTYLRDTGMRKLSSACLLEIKQQTKGLEYPLSCFMDYQKPCISYQSQIIVPFDLLDLCVTNTDGQACIDLFKLLADETERLPGYTKNFNKRYVLVCDHLKAIYNCRAKLEQYIARVPDISSDDAKLAYDGLLNEDALLKKFNVSDNILSYPVKRVCRLDELTTIDVVKEYGVTLSRIGHPFDFTV